MLDGTAFHCVNGEKFRLYKGDTVFIRPSDTHDYICENGKEFSMMNIAFSSDTADSLFSYLGDGFPSSALKKAEMPPTVHLSEHDLGWFCARMDSICAIDGASKNSIKLEIRILLFRILTRFFADADTDSKNMPQWLDRLLEGMKQNGNYIYGVERLLTLSDKSREHTLRSIKKYTGLTATEYINGLRLNFIANMLRNSNHSVSDIIFESGFNNISWASALFKEKYGMPMSVYRKSYD